VLLDGGTSIMLTSNLYNGPHQVTTNYDALNQKTTYVYNSSNQVQTVTTPTGLITTYVYYPNGRLLESVDNLGRSNSYSWLNGEVYQHTNELGLVTTYYSDGLRRLTGALYPDGTTTNVFTVSTTLPGGTGNALLDITGTKDKLNNWTYYGYNGIRKMIAVTNVILSHYTLYDYCACGELDSVQDALGDTTTYTYDYAGRLTNITYADQSWKAMSYDSLDEVTNTVDSAGVSITNYYNDQGLEIASSNAFGQIFSRSYDIRDRVTNSLDANGVGIISTYDNLNRLLSRSYPDGGIENFGYSAFGLVAYTNQLRTNITYYGYDAGLRKTAETNALDHTTAYAYDLANDLISLTDENGNTTKWGYDQYGRVTNKVNATETTILTYAYDADNRLTNRWSVAMGNTVYGYDNAGNLTSVTYQSSPPLSFSYNGDNWMTQMSDGIGTTTFTYTQTGQLASETGPWPSDTVAYTYSDRLRKTLSIQQPNSSPWAQTYGYDAANRLKTIAAPPGAFTYTYNSGLGGAASSSSLVGKVALPNGAYIDELYDNNGRMTTNCLYNSGGTPLDRYVYVYDKGNQRTQVTRNAENYANYAYDAIGEVIGDRAFESSGGTARLNEQLGYAFDPAGNLSYRTNNALVANFKVNNLNELTTNTNGGTLTVVGTTTSPASSVSVNGDTASIYDDATFATAGLPLTTTYTAIASDSHGRHSTNTVTVNLSANSNFQYDGNGNLTNDGLRNFVYDDENELIQVSVSSQWMSQFSYDGKMRRRIRKEYTWQNGAWLETNEVHYVYDGNLVIQERDMNNLPTVTYTRGIDLSGSLEGDGGIGGLLARTSQAYLEGWLAGYSYYHSDANGNITMLVDTNQSIVAKYLYDAFGNQISKSGLLADANTYRFSSKEYESNAGLVYYLYRYYDPNLQRWINRDPIEELGGINLFAFGNNQPTLTVDAFGFVNSTWNNLVNSFILAWNLIFPQQPIAPGPGKNPPQKPPAPQEPACPTEPPPPPPPPPTPWYDEVPVPTILLVPWYIVCPECLQQALNGPTSA
jgi:RHS repeat-associated protein